MNKNKIHPIYFNSFVGTWKRISLNGDPVTSNYFIKFNRDCTFEELNDRGTVNGDVDEVSVEGDGEGHQTALKQVHGRTRLIAGRARRLWAYQLDIEVDDSTKVTIKKLMLKNKQTYQLFELQTQFEWKSRKKTSRVKLKML